MHYFIDIKTEKKLVMDPEGADFADLAEAREEATQSLRDLLAERLRSGDFIHSGCASCVRDRTDKTVFEITVRELIHNNSIQALFFSERSKSSALLSSVEASAMGIFFRANKAHRQICEDLDKVRNELRMLTKLTQQLAGTVVSDKIKS